MDSETITAVGYLLQHSSSTFILNRTVKYTALGRKLILAAMTNFHFYIHIYYQAKLQDIFEQFYGKLIFIYILKLFTIIPEYLYILWYADIIYANSFAQKADDFKILSQNLVCCYYLQ